MSVIYVVVADRCIKVLCRGMFSDTVKELIITLIIKFFFMIFMTLKHIFSILPIIVKPRNIIISVKMFFCQKYINIYHSIFN